MRIQHLIPVTDAGASSALRSAEAFTLKTVRRALQKTVHDVDVVLLAHEGSGRVNAESSFASQREVLKTITQSLGGNHPPRSLPYLGHVLREVDKDCDITIFSNPDISLQPTFYEQVANLANEGFAGSITRRTILGKPRKTTPILFSRLQRGKSHPGHDCFFFPSKMAHDFALGDVFLGAPPVGHIMLLNIALLHQETLIFRDIKATYHFGDDRSWRELHNSGLTNSNKVAASAVLVDLVARHGAEKVRASGERLTLANMVAGLDPSSA